ncbi:MAG: hypothetical protein HY926_06705, partial [Elusimicrobia bacterium]|nr:hypothetical protein [Elusimicrobiota bacterium]
MRRSTGQGGWAWLGAFLWLLACPAFADQPMTSANYNLYRNGVDGGGNGGDSANYKSTGTVAETPIAVVEGSTSSSSNWALGPGLMNLAFFPGKVVTFSTSSISITSSTLRWSTTGYDGGIGDLRPGTTYFIRLATYTVPDTFFFSFAELSFSTQSTTVGQVVYDQRTALLPNTTYFAVIWTDDDAGNLSFASNQATFTTRAFPPASVPVSTFTDVAVSSMTGSWDDGGNSASVNLTTYTVVFTSDTVLTGQQVFLDAWPGNVVSSTTALSYRPPAGSLDDNTTYYLWARAVNHVGLLSPWSQGLGGTSTLTVPITHLTPYEYQYVFYDSATVRWARLTPEPPSPDKGGSEGYLVMASSTNFGTLPCCPGGVILTSATPEIWVSSLTINFADAGLDSYTTWYFQVGALNHNSAWNPVTMTRLNMQISQSTFAFTMGTIDPGLYQSTVAVSSMVIANVGNIPATYNVWATTMSPCVYQLG